MAGYLPTDADILDACYWRLSGVSNEQVQAEMETVRQWLASLPSFEQIIEDDPETQAIIEQLKRPNDKRKPWGLLVALIALVSHRNDDRALFYRAGYVVIQIHAQANRRACKGVGGDSLSLIIKTYVAERPEATNGEIADELHHLAGDYAYPVLVDSDPDTGHLTCQLGKELKDVSRQALNRRIQRARAV